MPSKILTRPDRRQMLSTEWLRSEDNHEFADFIDDLFGALDDAGVAELGDFMLIPVRKTMERPDDDALGPFQGGSDTSRRAALANYPRSGSQRLTVLEVIAANVWRGGITREEIATATYLSGDAVRPRVRELIDGGWVVEGEETHLTKAGNDAHVLRPTAKHVEWATAELASR